MFRHHKPHFTPSAFPAMASVALSLALALALALVGLPLAAQSGDAPPFARELTVTVDCDAGDTLAEALEARAESLTIEFQGSCVDNLVIERDRVTIRGLDASATLTGAPVAAPAIRIVGGQGVTLESFSIVDSLFGVSLDGSAGVTLEGMTVTGSSSAGLALIGSSFAKVIDSTFDDNGVFGISAFVGSRLELIGTIEASDNVVGVLASTGSAIEGSATVIADRTSISGLWLQIGSTAQLNRLQASDGLNFGLVLIAGGNVFVGNFDLIDNSFGILLDEQDVVDGGGQVLGILVGVIADEDSHLSLGNVVVSGAFAAIQAEGAALDLSNATIQGRATLSFGSTLTTNAGTTIGVLQCDGTVLTRGPISCPASLDGTESGGDSLAPSAPTLPDLGVFSNPFDR